ncbi:hypothetical protein [Blastopirellula retiformator]|uniref:Uncharacterized protein n=1 Tax=Blastopirellula retiformator TaxID=2527970 RepID=A0A5C5V810_9BACT|nr:hypothetical protein [Blastopirellula retiformator]TWT34696.1 hypothetical protein Enr8_21090 [Blastopirellula retiformator]
MTQQNSKDELAAERAELAQLRAELTAERQLLDEELVLLEQSQQGAAQTKSASGRIHQREVPADVRNVRAWLRSQGKHAIVRDYEVTLRSGNGGPRVVSPITAIDEAEAISIAFAQLKIESTQAYNPYAKVIST